MLRSVADFPAAGAPAASVCPDTGEAGRSVSGVFRRLGFAVRRGTGGRATRARSGLCAAAGLLLAFAAFLALPLQAQAQTIQTLVSNTGQTSNFNLAVGVSGSNTFAQALGFTTGDNTNGYTLSSVEVSFNASFDSTDEVRVSIYGADASGKPGSSLHVLVNPSSIPDAVQINSFNAPANATLAKETVYFVVVEAPTGTFAITGTSSAAEDSGKANGWAINDTRHDRFSDSGSWSLGGSNTKPKIAVKGTAKAPSTDATLSDLVVNDGTTDLTLDPTFVSGTFAYTTDVASSVEEVTLTATPNTGASVSAVTLDGNTIDDTVFTDGITVPSLDVGANVIVVTVTAEDTTTTQTYTVTVTQEAPTITAPAIVTGGVQVRSMPIATPDTYGLGETIEITVTFDHAVTVDTSGGTPRIQFRFDGAVNRWAAYSSGSGGTDLVFTYVVQSGDMDVDGIWLEENFLQLRNGTITAAADNTVDATLTYAEPGLQSQHKVNGSLTTTAATLSALTLNDGTTDHTINLATAPYEVDVGDAVTTVTLTATPTHTGASVSAVTLGGTAIADTDFTDGITVPSLIVGENVIVVTVTAEDTTTMKTYQVTVERLQYVCAAPDLSGRLEVWSATMTVGVDGTQFGFDRVDGTYGTLSGMTFRHRGIDYIVDAIYNELSSGNLNFDTRTAFPEGNLDQLRLHICAETFELANRAFEFDSTYIWSARNFNWSRGITVSVALSAEASSDTALSGLKLEESAGTAITLNQPFAFYRTDYTAAVANSVSRVTVTPTARDTYATLRYLDGAGNALADLDTLAAGHQVDLVAGANTIQVEVTAEDGVTTRTYTVEATRAQQADTDATLSALELSDGTLDPSFASDVTEYTASVGEAVERITVTAVKSDSAATVEFLDNHGVLEDRDPAAPGHQVRLWEGANAIRVAVTAGDGITNTYMLTVTRAAQSDTDATLSGLVLERLDGTPIALSPVFASNAIDYTAKVPFAVDEIRVTPTASDSAATIEWRRDTGDFRTVTDDFLSVLSPGDNIIEVKVTAGDGTTTKTYTVTVTKSGGTDFFCGFMDLSGRSEVWSAVLTVGRSSGSLFVFGYQLFTAESYGALSDTSFDYGGNSYTFRAIQDHPSNQFDALVIFLDAEFPDSERNRLRLHLCGNTFDLAEAGHGSGNLHYNWNNAVLDWSNATTVLVALSVENVAPVFEDGATATRAVAENTAAGTDFDTPVNATDEETLFYSLEGTDAASFDIDAGTGQLKTRAGVDLDYETKSSYDVIVKADDGTGFTATIAVTVNVGSKDEPPGVPAEPLVKAAGATSLSVMWTEPSNTGPAIDDYDLRYKVKGAAGWTNGPQNITDTSGTVTGLAEDTTYEVQVRATNAEGDGEWSAPGTGNTGSAASGKPEISGAAQAGQPLTAGRGTVTDLNGTTKADSNEPGYRYTYQWILVEGVTETDIMGAMSGTYTPAASDVGKKIKVRVSFTDDADMDETATSDPVGPVGAALGLCPTGRTAWCTTLTVGADGAPPDASYGYRRSGPGYGGLEVDGIDYGDMSYTVETLTVADGMVTVETAGGRVPHGSVFNLGGTEFTADAGSKHATGGYRWAAPANFAWFDGQKVTVSMRFGNFAATGKASITGIARYGEMLTVDKGTIADPDGTTKADNGVTGYAYIYQWDRIDGTTGELIDPDGVDTVLGSTYTLSAADIGNKVMVQVNFIDDVGNGELLFSNAYPATYAGVLPAEPGPCPAANDWCTTLTVGVKGEGTDPYYGYLRQSFGRLINDTIDYGTLSWTVTFLALDSEALIINDDGQNLPHGSVFSLGGTQFTVGSDSEDRPGHNAWEWSQQPTRIEWYEGQEVTVSVRLGNVAATGKPGITGTAQVGVELTATTSGIMDADGKTNADNGNAGYRYTYQWILDDGATETDIAGETSSTYTPVASDEGKTIKVRLSFTDDRDNTEEPLTSDPTATILARDNSEATGKPGITGEAQVDKILTATTSDIMDADGKTNAENGDSGYEYTYQWILVDGVMETDIAGETDSTYTPVATDVGKKVKIRVSFTDDRDNSETLTSDAYPAGADAITAYVNTPARGRPRITGTAREGQMLSADKDTITDDDGTTKADNGDAGYAYTYQWVRVDGGIETDITGETGSTYTPVATDVGKKIKVRVSFTDDRDNGEMRTSVATAAICDADEVWCATLTAKNLFNGRYGCADDASGDRHCSITSVLTEDEFTHGSTPTPYTVTRVERRSNGQLRFRLAPNLTTATGSLVLVVDDDKRFAFAHANVKQANNRRWNNSGLTWQHGTVVDLKLVQGSTVATLASLEVQEEDGTAIMLDPPFAADTLLYTAADVENAVDAITILAEASDSGARIKYFDESDSAIADGDTNIEGHQVSLAVGNNTIKVQVTAEDGVTVRTYTVTVARGEATTTCLAPNLTGRTQIWTGTVTVGANEVGGVVGAYGFGSGFGALDETEFSVGTNDYTVERVSVETSASPLAGLLKFGLTSALATADSEGLTLHVCDASFAFADAALSNALYNYLWYNSGLDWSSDTSRTLYLSVPSGNTVPTAADKTVTTDEDTAYTFAAADFNFLDVDSGDGLASVRVVTLPAVGALALDGAAVSVDQVVAEADIAKLTFTPALNANGLGYASFTFKVSDGTDESASAYTMTVNVTPVNDAATGAPEITGTPQVGQALTAGMDTIADAEDLPTTTFPLGYSFQWVRGGQLEQRDECRHGQQHLLAVGGGRGQHDQGRCELHRRRGQLRDGAQRRGGAGGAGGRRLYHRLRLVHDHDGGGAAFRIPGILWIHRFIWAA